MTDAEARTFTLFDDLELDMQFAPVCRLSDGALAAVELQLRGPSGTRLATAAALKRAARLVEEHPVLDQRKRKMATSPRAQSIAKILPRWSTSTWTSSTTSTTRPPARWNAT